MKRILLALSIVIASCTAAMAQSSTGPTSTSTQTDPKVLFSSSTSKFSAGISRSNSQLAQAGFSESMTVISNCIAQINQQLKSATTLTNKNTLMAQLQQEQQIQTDLQALQSNIISNAVQIETKFSAFKAIM